MAATDTHDRITKALPDGWRCWSGRSVCVIERESDGAIATLSAEGRWWSLGQLHVPPTMMISHGLAASGYQGANYIERMVRDAVAKIREVEG